MINIVIEQDSVDSVKGYLDKVRLRILEGMRVGMQESMTALAGEAVSAMADAGIRQHTYALATAILGSPKVTETSQTIIGTVSGDVGKKHIGLWMQDGTHVKAVEGKLMRFTTASGDTAFNRGHIAFDVRPHPFMNPALEAFKAPILEIIQARVNEALEA